MKFAVLLTLTAISWSASAVTVCTTEVDVTRSTSDAPVYLTAEEWQTAYDHFMPLEPTAPGAIDMWSAWTVYRSNLAQSRKFKKGRDKKQHCYMGCLMASQINYGTADYMAWYKEYLDITDCDAASYFDEKDLTATVKGAKYGAAGGLPTAPQCFQWCDQNIGRK